MPERHVLIDPFVVAVPADASQTTAFISGLLTWLPVLMSRRSEASFFQCALLILLQENRFPTHDTLSPLFARAQPVEYSVVDVLQMVTVLAATEPYFETFIQRRSALSENVSIKPSIVLDRLGATLGEATRDALVLAAIAHESGWCPDSTYWATSNWPEANDWLETTADVSLVELADGSVVSIDRSVTSLLHVLTDSNEIEFSGTVADVYDNPEAAVALLVHRMRQFDSSIPADVLVTTSDTFVPSLKSLGLDKQPAILETIYHRGVLAALGRLGQVKGAKLHPVRTSAAADAPQVERGDGAKLWRCMVTQKGAGYRLHYWSPLPDGRVELSAVMTESVV